MAGVRHREVEEVRLDGKAAVDVVVAQMGAGLSAEQVAEEHGITRRGRLGWSSPTQAQEHKTRASAAPSSYGLSNGVRSCSPPLPRPLELRLEPAPKEALSCGRDHTSSDAAWSR
jgi:hypothetical protein